MSSNPPDPAQKPSDRPAAEDDTESGQAAGRPTAPSDPLADPLADPAVPIEISPAQVQAWLAAGRPFVWLDCREQAEYDYVHLDSSRLLPMSELVARVDELEAYRDTTMVVYCHHGVRSLHVASWLQHQGFRDVRSLSGGIDRWASEIDRTLARY